MVWIIDHSRNGITMSLNVFDDENMAHEHACAMMAERIRSYWDMDVFEENECATQFNAFLLNREWKEGVQYWNEYCADHDRSNSVWSIELYMHRSKALTVIPLTSQELSGHPLNTVSLRTPLQALGLPTPFKASTCGATCRGCKQPNEYAYADKEDGTYTCTGCKMMKDVFNP